MTDKKIYNLSNVTKAIENVISTHCNKSFWVRAEIVKLNYYSQTGHAYPDLVEKKDGKILAEIRGNIWKSSFDKINTKFKNILNEALGDNMTIVCFATIKYNSVFGLSLNITDIDPSYTLGELAKQKGETIRKLKEEKFFNFNKEKSLPLIPKTIAIISVETSKGYSDFINVIDNNPWNYKFHLQLFPAVLQGERAVTTIISQLEVVKKYSSTFDTVVIIRGGGGDIGLSCYDDYSLAKAIALFPIPVLAGIGHSTNETVVELVSYKSFITPTKVSEFLLQQYHNFSVPLKENIDKINNIASYIFDKQSSNIKETARLFNSITNRFLDSQKHSITWSMQLIENSAHKLLLNEKINLRSNANSIQLSISKFIQSQNQYLFQVRSYIRSNTDLIFRNQNASIVDFQKYILILSKTFFEKHEHDINSTQDKITILSPINTLKRGFSITRYNGNSITESKQLKIGDKIETEVYAGKINSRVEKIDTNNNSILQWLKK